MVHAYQSKEDEQHEKQDWLAKAAAEAGFDVPNEALDNAPDLRQDLTFYLQAYNELSTVRPASFSGMAPLPYDKVEDYARRYKLDSEEFDDFCEIINSLDSKFRQFLDKESETPETSDGTSNKSNDRPGDRSGRGEGSS